mmetsp:Transcript_79774/g.252168  ORF Transcript_79774/g.252168 Transcript_79774/m.252168 type:complete len:242 (+) Transcript_79774:496-1221(+)
MILALACTGNSERLFRRARAGRSRTMPARSACEARSLAADPSDTLVLASPMRHPTRPVLHRALWRTRSPRRTCRDCGPPRHSLSPPPPPPRHPPPAPAVHGGPAARGEHVRRGREGPAVRRMDPMILGRQSPPPGQEGQLRLPARGRRPRSGAGGADERELATPYPTVREPSDLDPPLVAQEASLAGRRTGESEACSGAPRRSPLQPRALPRTGAGWAAPSGLSTPPRTAWQAAGGKQVPP